jgi:hypothetical protein
MFLPELLILCRNRTALAVPLSAVEHWLAVYFIQVVFVYIFAIASLTVIAALETKGKRIVEITK